MNSRTAVQKVSVNPIRDSESFTLIGERSRALSPDMIPCYDPGSALARVPLFVAVGVSEIRSEAEFGRVCSWRG